VETPPQSARPGSDRPGRLATQVYRIFSPSEERSKACEFFHDPSELMKTIKTRYQSAAQAARSGRRGVRARSQKPSYDGEFLGPGRAAKATGSSRSHSNCWQGARTCGGLNSCVGAVLPCGKAGTLPAQLIAAGADAST